MADFEDLRRERLKRAGRARNESAREPGRKASDVANERAGAAIGKRTLTESYGVGDFAAQDGAGIGKRTLAESCVRAVIDPLAWVRRQSIEEAM